MFYLKNIIQSHTSDCIMLYRFTQATVYRTAAACALPFCQTLVWCPNPPPPQLWSQHSPPQHYCLSHPSQSVEKWNMGTQTDAHTYNSNKNSVSRQPAFWLMLFYLVTHGFLCDSVRWCFLYYRSFYNRWDISCLPLIHSCVSFLLNKSQHRYNRLRPK